jgi:hypothetical protein
VRLLSSSASRNLFALHVFAFHSGAYSGGWQKNLGQKYRETATGENEGHGEERSSSLIAADPPAFPD